MTEDYEVESQNWMDKVKESPRTVSALIIVLIVAAAVYAFSGEEKQVPEEGLGTVTEETTTENEGTNTEVADNEDAVTNEQAESSQALTVVTQQELTQSVTQLPEVSRTDGGYVESAQAGEGITHLARRAATRWLSENQAGYEVTNEHRIYIEDYIQNRIGSQGLEIGEQITISYDMVKEAVSAAGQMQGSQLQNLTQYTPALT